MKLLFVCLFALFTVAFANVVELKSTAEDGDVTRLETDEIASEDQNALETSSEDEDAEQTASDDEDALETASDDEDAVETASQDEDAVMEKRGCFRPRIRRCQVGSVKSRYCHGYSAQKCFKGKRGWRYVKFRVAFRRKPRVTLGFNLIDTHKDRNVRVRASAVRVTRRGFYVRFYSWSNSITYSLGVSWMACP